MAVGDIYKGRIYCYNSPILSVNTRHWRVFSEQGTGATQQQIAAGVDTAIAANMKNLISLAAVYRGVYMQKIRPTVAVPSASTLGAGPGLGTGGTLPPQCAGILSFRTARAGRAFRGRLYAPFAWEDANTGAQPTVDYTTKLAALGTNLISQATFGVAGNLTTLQPIIYHRKTATYDDIVDFLVRVNWGVVRRRAYGRGSDLPPF